METKHTKGEWKVTTNEYNDVAPLFIQCKSSILADVHKNINNQQESIANAKLIAAAPELLEACIIALKYFNGFDSPEQNEAAFHALNNAIKKATE